MGAIPPEQSEVDARNAQQVEAFLGASYEFFTYDTPKTTLTTSLTVFPSLTESGRVRGNLDFALRRELIEDIHLEEPDPGRYDRLCGDGDDQQPSDNQEPHG